MAKESCSNSLPDKMIDPAPQRSDRPQEYYDAQYGLMAKAIAMPSQDSP
jgi:hypothetical protein